jgi:sulfite reductase (NADPH) flavoprotein alpha-component
LFILRDAKNMARDVSEILIGICEKEGEMGRTQAMQYVKDLGQKSRYVQDVWS